MKGFDLLKRFHLLRFYFALPLHLKITKFKWYKNWHHYKHYKKVHALLLFVYVLSVIAPLFVIPSESHASLVQKNNQITSQVDFNKGTFNNTNSTNNNGGEVELSGFSALSNNGGGVWKYKRAITIDNPAGQSNLSDYQVQLNLNEYKDSVQYHFEETTGTTVTDSSNNGVTGNANGVIGGNGPSSIAGKFGNALYFDGTDDQISLGNPAILKNNISQTISMWIKPTDFATRRTFFNKTYGGEGTINIETSGLVQYFYGSRGSDGWPYQNVAAATAIPANSWSHIAIVRDLKAMKLRIYINGVKNYETNANITVPTTSTANLLIGNGYTTYFKGGIDEVGIYSGVLGDTEINQLYTSNAIDITSDSLFEKSASDGRDIRFTDSDGQTELSYWNERYVKDWRYMKSWIKVPSIQAGVPKTIYMYYGNSLATDSSSASNTGVREIGGLQAGWSFDYTFQDWSGNGSTLTNGFYSRTTLSNCDGLTSWSGGTVTTDSVDKQEGSASIQSNFSSPLIGTTYKTIYNPNSTWDLRYPDYYYFWIKPDRASTAYTNPRFYIYDTLGNYRYWNISYTAGSWQLLTLQASGYNGQSATAPNMLLSDSLSIEATALDTTPFINKFDLVEYRIPTDVGDWSATYAKSNRSGNFDGREDFLSAPSNMYTTPSAAWTLEAWVNTRQAVLSGQDRQMIFSKWGSNSGSSINYSLEINVSGKLVAKVTPSSGGSVVVATGNTTLNASQWYHVSATFDNTQLKVYVNGAVDGSAPTGFAANGNSSPLKIGSYDFTWTTYKHNFNGYIDDPKIYNRALSSQEILDLANNYGYFSLNSPGKVIVIKTATVPPTITLNSENVASSLIGTYFTSSDPANAIDLFWHGGWGAGLSNFNANVVIPSGNIIFEARTSDIGGLDPNWSEWVNLGTATVTGLYETNSGSDPVDTLLTQRYLQLKVTINSGGTTSPILSDFSILYFSDENPPNNPSNIIGYTDNGKTAQLTDSNWSNSSSPYFEWTEPIEEAGESGVKGYWVYFGTDSTADPKTSGVFRYIPNFQASLSDADSGKTYYLAISAEDVAGNRITQSAPDYYKNFTYKFDKTAPNVPSSITVNPVGWTTINEFNFSWQAATDQLINGDASGIKGYQYKRGGGGDVWYPPLESPLTSLNVVNITSYQNGQNNFFIRSVDNAGNVSQEVKINYYYNADAPTKPTSLTVDPQSSTENSFNFKWDLPATFNNQIKGYYYSINTEPNQNNSKFIALNAVGLTETGVIPAAVQQGFNRFYVVAIDSNDNINWANYESIEFECNTSAPSMPLKPEVFDTSNRDQAKYSVALNWLEPSFKGVGFAGYVIERSDDNINFSQIGSSAGQSYVDTNLSSRLYYYRILAKDNTNNLSVPSEIVNVTPTGKYTSPPALTHGPEVATKVSTASIRWFTDREASSFVEIGESVNYNLTQGQFEFTTDHQVKIERLKPDTIYHYRVKFVDVDGNIGYSQDQILKTMAAPYVTNVNIEDVKLNSAIISWNTTTPAQATILYGRTSSYSSSVENVSGGFTTSHSIILRDLSHSNKYYFRIKIKDIDNNEILSDEYSFETLKYPQISVVRLEAIKNMSTAAMKFTWDTNVPTTSIVEFQPRNGAVQETVKSKLESKHDLVISGLLDNTYYEARIIGRDQFGNEATSDIQRFKTEFDTRPPVIADVYSETSLSGFGLESKSQGVISWQTDEVSTSRVEYSIGMTGTEYTFSTKEDTSFTTSHVVVISDLKPSTTYHFRVVSKDEAGNEVKSDDQYILTEQARSSVLEIILRSFETTLGWLFN
jgi:hypothetical protein